MACQPNVVLPTNARLLQPSTPSLRSRLRHFRRNSRQWRHNWRLVVPSLNYTLPSRRNPKSQTPPSTSSSAGDPSSNPETRQYYRPCRLLRSVQQLLHRSTKSWQIARPLRCRLRLRIRPRRLQRLRSCKRRLYKSHFTKLCLPRIRTFHQLLQRAAAGPVDCGEHIHPDQHATGGDAECRRRHRTSTHPNSQRGYHEHEYACAVEPWAEHKLEILLSNEHESRRGDQRAVADPAGVQFWECPQSIPSSLRVFGWGFGSCFRPLISILVICDL
jgi:hypothetical protein